jgi:hypothetical protein
MDFEFLFKPVEDVDAWLTGLFDGAPLLVALLIAFALGLRHASDPDHLVAVTSLVASDSGDVRGATRLGAWWGLGHAGTLLAVGLPLIALKGELPAWLENGAETWHSPCASSTAGGIRRTPIASAPAARRSGSACSTDWRAPARWSCC